MKIYNEIVFEWVDGSLQVVLEDSFEYSGEVSLCSGGGGGSGDQVVTTMYAPYIQTKHEEHLDDIFAQVNTTLEDDSPFADYEDIDIVPAFFGDGYTIASFPSLYDMYGKFMAGLDIDALFDQMFEETVNSSEVSDLVAAESDLMDDEVETSLARTAIGLRNIGAVMSSQYDVALSNIEAAKVKSISKFSAELKYRLIPVAVERWGKHLEWNSNVVSKHAELMKLYYLTKLDTDQANYEMSTKDKLWPFTIYNYERASLGALHGAKVETTKPAGASDGQKALGGALSGAAAGFQLTGGNPIGAAVGGILGLAGSFL